MSNAGALRAKIVSIARSWLLTPYHSMGRVKGAGVDCGMLPLAVYHEAGILAEIPEVPYYPLDWAAHRDEERYLEFVERMVRENGWKEVPPPPERTPLPGDFLLFHFARVYSHGVIVAEWPECIHAHVSRGVVLVNALGNRYMAKRVEEGKVKAYVILPGEVSDVR